MSTSADISAAELAAQLRAPLLRLNRVIRLQRVDTSVTLTQLSALGMIGSRGPMSAGELAAYERVQPPSMTKILAGLEDAGLIRRAPHPSDKRQAIIAITDAGSELLESERRSRDAWLSVQLAKLTGDERALLLQVAPLLGKLAEL
jgi:DNA-binding MarR family transcriptional regulator